MSKAKVREIDPWARDILARSTIEGNVLKLPEQLHRVDYVAIAKILGGLGGKWDRKIGGHVFDYDPSTLLGEAVSNGAYRNRKQVLQFFETPSPLALEMIRLAQLCDGDRVLEPSAGRGAILSHLHAGLDCIVAVEIDPDHCMYLVDTFGKPAQRPSMVIVHDDFLEWGERTMTRYDAVIMNPPFTRGQDVEHIRLAWRLLAPKGRLVAVCSESPFFGTRGDQNEFRVWLGSIGAIIDRLPGGTFKSSGTNVNTRLIWARKR